MRNMTAGLSIAVLLILGAAACGSGSDNASSSKDSTSTTAGSNSTTTTPKTTSTLSSTHCTTGQLKGSLGETQSGAGQRYTALVLTNTGSTECDLRGFPGVSLVDASGKQIGQPASREGAEGATVMIQPGGTASATLHTSAAGMGAQCDATSAQLRVYPPDNTESLMIAAAYSACGGFQVTTLVAGSAGN
jgi:ABC-type transport system substrate-binding protein